MATARKPRMTKAETARIAAEAEAERVSNEVHNWLLGLRLRDRRAGRDAVNAIANAFNLSDEYFTDGRLLGRPTVRRYRVSAYNWEGDGFICDATEAAAYIKVAPQTLRCYLSGGVGRIDRQIAGEDGQPDDFITIEKLDADGNPPPPPPKTKRR